MNHRRTPEVKTTNIISDISEVLLEVQTLTTCGMNAIVVKMPAKYPKLLLRKSSIPFMLNCE